MSKIVKLLIVIMLLTSVNVKAQKSKHSFKFQNSEFILDGSPFQIISGEIHPARIPAEYWRHRIQMAKAMGCNTISAYIFWNYQETEEGVYDFTTGNHNIGQFFKMAQEEGMWVILRPGPYVCAEWDLGGIPPYLLRIPDIQLRSIDPRYIAAAGKYMTKLADEVKPFMVTKGGPILMIQIENEYGSYGNDKNYLQKIKSMWTSLGIDIPTFTADGPTTKMLEAGTLPGSAVGLDSGTSAEDFALAAKINPGVPVFSSETYPGWLTHWGEQWAKPDTTELLKELRFLLDNKKSFNLYMIHGGTNFDYTAGANSGGKGYEPDITSYDYDAPINEQGMPTAKYMSLRNLIGSYLPKGKKLPPIPAPVPTFEISSLKLQPFTSLWDNLPQPVTSDRPKTFEANGLDHGLMLYSTELTGQISGKLKVNDIHDYATVFLNGNYIGTLDRREGINSLDIPAGNSPTALLEILVEGMGRINFGSNIIDRKGITESVTLNGTELLNWKMYSLPLDRKFIWELRSSGRSIKKPGVFFKGNFVLSRAEGNIYSDTFIDMSEFTKGMVWVNGHNLGRFWDIGPQKRLYCPSNFLREGLNEIMVFDFHETITKQIRGFKTQQ